MTVKYCIVVNNTFSVTTEHVVCVFYREFLRILDLNRITYASRGHADLGLCSRNLQFQFSWNCSAPEKQKYLKRLYCLFICLIVYMCGIIFPVYLFKD